VKKDLKDWSITKELALNRRVKTSNSCVKILIFGSFSFIVFLSIFFFSFIPFHFFVAYCFIAFSLFLFGSFTSCFLFGSFSLLF
jgi:hypothetical protein